MNVFKNFVNPMRLKAGENLSCLNFLNPKVGEYLTFMEELSALRRHTVSEVKTDFSNHVVGDGDCKCHSECTGIDCKDE